MEGVQFQVPGVTPASPSGRRLLSPTITKKVGFLLLLPTCGAFIALAVFYSYLTQMATNEHFINVAGHQRLVSQQLLHYAGMAYSDGEEYEQALLREAVSTFDQSLQALEQGGPAGVYVLVAAPAGVQDEVANVRRLWVGLKESLLIVVNRPADDPQAGEAYKHVLSDIHLLTAASDQVVTSFELWEEALRRRMLSTLVAIAGLDLALFLAGLWLTKRHITHPILVLEQAARHIQQGDFSHRVSVVTRDELEMLAEAFNEMSDSRARTEALIRESEERYRRLVELSPEAIVVHSGDRIVYANIAAEKLFGATSPDDYIGRPVLDFVHPDYRELIKERIRQTYEREGEMVDPIEEKLTRLDGQLLDAEVTAVGVTYCGKPATQVFIHDITERKKFEAQLAYLVDHDPLTGLFNRRHFQEEMPRQISHALRYGSSGAVLFLDLDNFKYVNDTLGHRAGDELLRTLGSRLRERLRETDILARIGGDEFAVLLPQADMCQAREVAEKILEAIGDQDVVIEGQPIRITASIGIAMFPEHGRTAEDLLAHADLAMYRAKGDEHNRIYIHSPGEG